MLKSKDDKVAAEAIRGLSILLDFDQQSREIAYNEGTLPLLLDKFVDENSYTTNLADAIIGFFSGNQYTYISEEDFDRVLEKLPMLVEATFAKGNLTKHIKLGV